MKLFKALLLATVCAVAISSPALAGGGKSAPKAKKPAAESSELALVGVFDFQGGWRRMTENDDDVSDSHLMLAGDGRVSIPLNDKFSAQLDAQTEWFNVNDNEEGTPIGNSVIGGHLSARDPEKWLVGGFAAAAIPTSTDTSPSNEAKWLGGVEAQGYFNNFTIYGQVGWANVESDDEPEGFSSGFFYRGVGRYFFDEDTMVSGEYAYGKTKHYIDGDDDGRIRNWAVSGAKLLPTKQPLYGTLEYRGGKYDTTTEGDIARDHAFLAGIKLQFGAQSLKHNDRYGATLDTPMLPVRAASWAESLD